MPRWTGSIIRKLARPRHRPTFVGATPEYAAELHDLKQDLDTHPGFSDPAAEAQLAALNRRLDAAVHRFEMRWARLIEPKLTAWAGV